MQKSPKKRTVNTEDKFQEEPSPMSEVIKHFSVPSSKEENSRLNGEKIKVTRPKQVAAEQNFTSVQTQEQTEDMSCVFEESMRKSASFDASQCFPTCHSVAAEGAVTPSSVCHDARTTEDQLNIYAEKHMYVLSTFNDFLLIRVLTNSKISHKLLHRDSELYDYLAYGVAQWT
jgi:hypothetical protein